MVCMLFLVMGASGSGKSTCLAGIRNVRPDVDWRDFDDLPSIPTNTAERQTATEGWLQLAIANEQRNVSTGIVGTVVLGEVLACPSALHIEKICPLLLDCHDVTRIDRIRGRDATPVWASQDMLSWAAWQRMHAVDPQWRQDVIQADGAEGMQWDRWRNWQRGDPRWQVETLDSTLLTIEQTVNWLVDWVALHQPLIPAGAGAPS
jgi:hypothetical protein